LLPVARQQASERRAPSLQAKRPRVDWARWVELQERVARVPQVPQLLRVLAQQAQRDAPEVRSPCVTAPLRVSSMEPQLRDAPARTELVRALRAWKKAQRATRARRDARRQERLQQALRAEAL
jgi:hypothetical protein